MQNPIFFGFYVADFYSIEVPTLQATHKLKAFNPLINSADRDQTQANAMSGQDIH